MKRYFMTLIVLSICVVLSAQDIIVKRDGTRIDASVQMVGETEIFYKVLDNQEGQGYTIKKSEVSTIVYKNGKVETFEVKQEEQQAKEEPAVQYPEIALEDIHGYVLKEGNCVYVPIDGKYDYDRAAQEKLKQLLKEWGYWIVVDDVKQAHFVIQYETCINGCTPDKGFAYIRHRQAYQEKPFVKGDGYTYLSGFFTWNS